MESEAGRPLLVYDGDCGFCSRCAELAARVSTRPRIVPWQDTDLAALGTTAARADYELLWVAPDGRIVGGAQAVARFLVAAGPLWAGFGLLLRLPPLRWIAHAVYRLVAANRHRLPGGTAGCAVRRDPGA